MNRKPWKCCGKTFSGYRKYFAHVFIFHNENADYERTNASDRKDGTMLDESQESCSKQIRVTKNTTGMNEYKKDISVVDSISIKNDSNRIIETPTKNECKKNIAYAVPSRSSTNSNKLFKEPTNIFVRREQDGKISRKSEKRSIESYVKRNASEIKIHMTSALFEIQNSYFGTHGCSI
ncbi:hypothetical protein NPIL_310951 [Nephila pilipes]|uniref:Uncharacterized protein n=1 Tax=Nephila pilipes TaxID=299642 RepID=A0A8X6TI09_NEPPI|nr:hypothetical protein NPIL_310951 [Nephila pilipes]